MENRWKMEKQQHRRSKPKANLCEANYLRPQNKRNGPGLTVCFLISCVVLKSINRYLESLPTHLYLIVLSTNTFIIDRLWSFFRFSEHEQHFWNILWDLFFLILLHGQNKGYLVYFFLIIIIWIILLPSLGLQDRLSRKIGREFDSRWVQMVLIVHSYIFF